MIKNLMMFGRLYECKKRGIKIVLMLGGRGAYNYMLR